MAQPFSHVTLTTAQAETRLWTLRARFKQRHGGGNVYYSGGSKVYIKAISAGDDRIRLEIYRSCPCSNAA